MRCRSGAPPGAVALPVIVTLHPSAVLRAGDRRDERRAELAHDLALVRTTLEAKGVATAARG